LQSSKVAQSSLVLAAAIASSLRTTVPVEARSEVIAISAGS
jgi:hypothetical protein